MGGFSNLDETDRRAARQRLSRRRLGEVAVLGLVLRQVLGRIQRTVMVAGHVIMLPSLVALHLATSFGSHVQSLKLRVGVLEVDLVAVTPLNLVMASRMAFDHSMVEERVTRLPRRLRCVRSAGWLRLATGAIHTVRLRHLGPLADLDTELGGWRLPILMAIILSGSSSSIHKI